MESSLFKELIKIGVDEELAAKVSASLAPEYNASKQDILVMQEAIMQVQLRSDERHHELNNKMDRSYHELNSKIDQSSHELNNKIDQSSHELNNKIDQSYHELNNKIESVKSELRSEMHEGFSSIRTDMASYNRQYLITFGGLITTIVTVFLINLYFHF